MLAQPVGHASTSWSYRDVADVEPGLIRQAGDGAYLAVLTRASCAVRVRARPASADSGRGAPVTSKLTWALWRRWWTALSSASPSASGGVSARRACRARRVSTSPSVAMRRACARSSTARSMSRWSVSTAWAAWIWTPEGTERVSQDVVDLPGDAVALVQGGRPVLLLVELLGFGQQSGGLLGLDTVAAQEAAEDAGRGAR